VRARALETGALRRLAARRWRRAAAAGEDEEADMLDTYLAEKGGR